jgi:cbb3-type cytochrome c oxidase subunit III
MAPTPVEQEIKSEQDKLAFGKPTAELEWDGIRKLDMPPPKWWVYVFWATFFWAAAWWILYPAWPSLRGHTDGILGYDQREVRPTRPIERVPATELPPKRLVPRCR